MPSDLSPALLLDKAELTRLQERTEQLSLERNEQRDLYCQARQHHVKLIHDRKDMEAKIHSKLCASQHTILTCKNQMSYEMQQMKTNPDVCQIKFFYRKVAK